MNYQIDSVIEMKKPHACGNAQMKIVRTGADIKVECIKCKARIMMPKHEFDKKIKKRNDNISS